nr:MAG TPA: hypothetical protein [Caudoviricetes sp.]
MTRIKLILIAMGVAVIIAASGYGAGYLKGWCAHSEKVNRDAEKRRQVVQSKQAKSTTQSQQVRVVTETKYKTIYRDVVKYVSDPNRNVCVFDDNYQRLRQQSLDADASISRDAGSGVRIVESGAKK